MLLRFNNSIVHACYHFIHHISNIPTKYCLYIGYGETGTFAYLIVKQPLDEHHRITAICQSIYADLPATVFEALPKVPADRDQHMYIKKSEIRK